MSRHLKRLVAPESWHIPRKVKKFVLKTAPGPHNAGAMPVGVWLREHAGLALNGKEVRQILHQGDIIVNGRTCKDPQIGLGVFDIIAIPRVGKYYRVQLDKQGRLITVPISEESAKTRLCRIRNKTVVNGGKVQLNLMYGANILADNTYKPKDSIVVTLGDHATSENRFKIVDHFPFTEGNVAMVIGGRHSGKVGRVVEIVKTQSSVPNRVVLEDGTTGVRYETIEDYVFMVGRSAIAPELEATA
jgi:small subunit ribosomal protein S4e